MLNESMSSTTQVIDTPTLHIAYESWGDPENTPVILLHGFPDDARSWGAVGAGLAAAGYRACAPYVRGCGATHFRDEAAARSGQLAAQVQDVLDFADALGLAQFALIGHDWGSHTAQAVAALYPERVTRLVSLSPYSITWDSYQSEINFAQIHALWYQFVFNSEMGAGLLYADRRGFARYLWQSWSPTWTFSEAEFDAAAASFDNPDYIPVVLDAYNRNPAAIISDPRAAHLEPLISASPRVTVPTVVLLGKDDGINLFDPAMLAQSDFFTGDYHAYGIDGVGHFMHRERPQVIIDALLGRL